MEYHSREEWQLPGEPVKGPGMPVNWSTIIDSVLHYPGSNVSSNTVTALRNMQSSYLRLRGYSLGYNFAIPMIGGVWEIRGLDILSAATGGYNPYSIATIFLNPGTTPLTDAQIDTYVWLHREMERQLKKSLGIWGHRNKGTTKTICPGDGIYPTLPKLRELVKAPITPTPIPTPKPTEELDIYAMERFIRPANSQAIYACFPGFKVWLKDHDSYTLRANLNNLAKHPERNELIDAANRELMVATYPILGPIPPGHDSWGSPL